MKITGDHVKALAAPPGRSVLVSMPEKAGPPPELWVIGTRNKHYEGAETARATSDQVFELAEDDDYGQDGELTRYGAWRIADILNETPRSEAIASARQMPHPEGNTTVVSPLWG